MAGTYRSWVNLPARYDILVANRFAAAACRAIEKPIVRAKSHLIPRCGTIEKGVFSLGIIALLLESGKWFSAGWK
jgi:hypothetical protein